MSIDWKMNLLRTATYLVKYDRDMPLTRMQVLLIVMLKEGCLVRDITARTGLNQSTVARSLGFLGDKPVRGQKEGLGWVEMRPDHEDPRRVRCYLTPKGKQVTMEIETLVT